FPTRRSSDLYSEWGCFFIVKNKECVSNYLRVDQKRGVSSGNASIYSKNVTVNHVLWLDHSLSLSIFEGQIPKSTFRIKNASSLRTHPLSIRDDRTRISTVLVFK